jgi:hypothetical protein
MLLSIGVAVATVAAEHLTVAAVAAGRFALGLRAAGNPVPQPNPTAPPGSDKIMTIISWISWGVFAAAFAGVLIICIKMAINSHRNRSGDGGGEEAGKLFWPLLACIVAGAASGLIGAVS